MIIKTKSKKVLRRMLRDLDRKLRLVDASKRNRKITLQYFTIDGNPHDLDIKRKEVRNRLKYIGRQIKL